MRICTLNPSLWMWPDCLQHCAGLRLARSKLFHETSLAMSVPVHTALLDITEITVRASDCGVDQAQNSSGTSVVRAEVGRKSCVHHVIFPFNDVTAVSCEELTTSIDMSPRLA